MAGATIQDQVYPFDVSLAVKKSFDSRSEVFSIVSIQTLCPHPTVVDSQAAQQINRAVASILKFLPFDLSRTTALNRPCPFQHLQVGLLVDTHHDLAVCPQPVRAFVAPEDLGGLLYCSFIPDRRLPVAKTVRLQIGSPQNVRHRREMHCVEDLVTNGLTLQTAHRPVRQFKSVIGRIAARQVFQPHPL